MLAESTHSALLTVVGGPAAFLGENTRHHGDEVKLNKGRFAPVLCLYQKESTGTPRETAQRDSAGSAVSLEQGRQIWRLCCGVVECLCIQTSHRRLVTESCLSLVDKSG